MTKDIATFNELLQVRNGKLCDLSAQEEAELTEARLLKNVIMAVVLNSFSTDEAQAWATDFARKERFIRESAADKRFEIHADFWQEVRDLAFPPETLDKTDEVPETGILRLYA